MFIATSSLKIRTYESKSLKDKRRVIKSLIERLKSRYNISIAEVGLNESWQTSIIGLAYVSNDGRRAQEILSKIIDFIDKDSRLEIIEETSELIKL